MNAAKTLTTTNHAANDEFFNKKFRLYKTCRIVESDTYVTIGGAVTRDADGMVLQALVFAADGRSWLMDVDQLDSFVL